MCVKSGIFRFASSVRTPKSRGVMSSLRDCPQCRVVPVSVRTQAQKPVCILFVCLFVCLHDEQQWLTASWPYCKEIPEIRLGLGAQWGVSWIDLVFIVGAVISAQTEKVEIVVVPTAGKNWMRQVLIDDWSFLTLNTGQR